MQRLAIILVGLGILIFVVSCPVLFLGSTDSCANEIVSEVPSPNGKLKAVIFTRDCGATTAFSRQVSIVPGLDNLPNDGGNVYISGDVPTLSVRWTDDQNLTISGGGAVSPFPVEGFPGVRVTYQ